MAAEPSRGLPAARLLLAWLAWPRMVVTEQDTPMPTREECPECAFGKWDCHRSCTGQEDFGRLDTDFTYKAQDCIEEIPTGDNAVQVDLDIKCIYGFLPLECDNMHRYRFDGVSFVEDCTPTTPLAADLLNETCSWVCKRGDSPTARCKWHFDPNGQLSTVGAAGTQLLDMCWVGKSCQNGEVIAEAACRPTAPFEHKVIEGWNASWNATLEETKQDHSEASQSLMQEIEKLKRSNQEAQQKSKEKEEDKEDAEKKNTVLIVVVVVVLVLSCVLIIGGGFMINKLLLKPSSATAVPFESQVAADGGVMVVGRPVGNEQPGNAPTPGKGGKEKGDKEPLRAGAAGKADPPSPPKTAWK